MAEKRFTLIPAVFLVLKKDDKFLFSKRMNTGYGNGQYSLVSGHVEDGESVVSAMIREAKEEIGIVLRPQDLILIHTLHYTSDDDGYKALMLFFAADQWEGEIGNMEPDKCSDLNWFSMDNFPENTLPYIRQVMHCIHNDITYSDFGWN